jgi:hypothetical protein
MGDGIAVAKGWLERSGSRAAGRFIRGELDDFLRGRYGWAVAVAAAARNLPSGKE